MRFIAVLSLEHEWDNDGFSVVMEAFSDHGLVETKNEEEQSRILGQMVEDMPERDTHRFKRTVRYLAEHSVNGTVASICVLDNKNLLLRLRNPVLRKLMPVGEGVLSELLRHYGVGDAPKIKLTECEIRERGQHEGFFFGEWRSGSTSFWELLYGVKKAYYIAITLMLIGGLLLEVGLTLMEAHSVWAELGQRLGAPMLVSGSVLLMERFAHWLYLRRPSLYWSPIPNTKILLRDGSA